MNSTGTVTLEPVAVITLIVLLAANLLGVGIAWGVIITKVDGVQKAISRDGADGLVGRRELVTALEDNRRVHSEIKSDVRGIATTVVSHGEQLGALSATVKAIQDS